MNKRTVSLALATVLGLTASYALLGGPTPQVDADGSEATLSYGWKQGSVYRYDVQVDGTAGPQTRPDHQHIVLGARVGLEVLTWEAGAWWLEAGCRL